MEKKAGVHLGLAAALLLSTGCAIAPKIESIKRVVTPTVSSGLTPDELGEINRPRIDRLCEDGPQPPLQIKGRIEMPKSGKNVTVVFIDQTIGKWIPIDEITNNQSETFEYFKEIKKDVLARGGDDSSIRDIIVLTEGNYYQTYFIEGEVPRDRIELLTTSEPLIAATGPIVYSCFNQPNPPQSRPVQPPNQYPRIEFRGSGNVKELYDLSTGRYRFS